MYRPFWSLDKRPFQSDCDPRFFFRSESHQAALLKLRYVVEQQMGAGLLAGGTGYGKSYLAHLLQPQLSETAGPLVRIEFPQLPPAELLSYIAVALGGDETRREPEHDRLDRIVREIESRLAHWTQQGRHPVVVVDEAHLINDGRVFQALGLLLNLQQRPDMGCSVILLGEPSLLPKVQRTGPWSELIAVRALLQPLTSQETADYIAHRLAIAGRSEPVFDQDALSAVFELSGGVPRRINRLCELALLVGYAEKLDRIPAEVVESIAEELTLDAAA